MKKTKTLNWLLVIIGTLSLFSSIFLFAKGHNFGSYFWGGLCGAILIGTGSMELKKAQQAD